MLGKAKITGKKGLLLTAAIMFFSLINPGFSQEENQHKTIVEKVEVNITGKNAPGLL